MFFLNNGIEKIQLRTMALSSPLRVAPLGKIDEIKYMDDRMSEDGA
jgi:hypothetical protein